MQLSRKVIPTQKPVEKKVEPMDLSGYVSVDSCEITTGKYRGKTWGWVKKHDEPYRDWLLSSGVAIQWGCYIPIEQKEVRKWSGYIADDGSRWVGLVGYDISCTPADVSWYQ